MIVLFKNGSVDECCSLREVLEVVAPQGGLFRPPKVWQETVALKRHRICIFEDGKSCIRQQLASAQTHKKPARTL